MELSWRLVDSGEAIESYSVQPTCSLESLNIFGNIITLFITWYCQFETIQGKQKLTPLCRVMMPLDIQVFRKCLLVQVKIKGVLMVNER